MRKRKLITVRFLLISIFILFGVTSTVVNFSSYVYANKEENIHIFKNIDEFSDDNICETSSII